MDHSVATRRAGLSPAKQALLAKRLRGEAPATGSIGPRPRTDPAPLSFAQQRLWFLNQLEPDSPLYNMPLAVRLQGRLDETALHLALEAVVARHEPLRTRCVATENGPIQQIDPPAPVPLRQVNLRSLPETEREPEARRLLETEARRPFDLSRDPMLRALLTRVDDTEWRLLVTLHHIAADGWSWGIFCRELSALYDAFIAGRTASLPQLPIQYADFAWWQQQTLRGERLEQQLAYWKQQLAGAPRLLELPTDHPRPARQTSQGRTQSRPLPGALRDELLALSREEGATLFMTLLAAFQAVLHRYTRQSDLLVGTPLAGRQLAETEPLIGFFINTLVLRSRLSGDPTFRTLLRQVREATLEAVAHQDLPFEKLVEELQPQRSPSHSPLVQVMFVLQNLPVLELHLTGATVSPLPLDTGTAKFDLTLALIEDASGLQASAEYNADLFEPATIGRFLDHYHTLLEAIVADPDRRLSELPLLSPAERRLLLVDWNQTRTDYPRHHTVHQLFEQQAERTPTAVAVTLGKQALTYDQLNRRANQLAHYLQRLGVGPDRLVGICAERSLDLVIGLLAILKAGGAYVPLDPTYPEERLRLLLEDAGLSVVLAQEKFSGRLTRPQSGTPAAPVPAGSGVNPAELHLVCLENGQERFAAESTANPLGGATADHLAYVSYTSGSTGRPKGVCVPHRAVVRLVRGNWFIRSTPDQVFLQLAPLAFDASTFELWAPLLNGARLAVFPPGTPSLAELAEGIRDQRVTTLWLTTGLFNQMVEEQLEDLRGIRQLLVGGDVLSVPHVRRARQALPGCQLINGYGPTENTTFTCCYPIADVSPAQRSIPIGRPVANTQVYVLDPFGQPVPIGVPGELFAGGDGLARGYLHQAGLTSERFVPHPFSSDPAARLYRTGDLVRYLPDGNLDFLGRIDQQVKIRGFRVELGEIEAVLAQHHGVQDCAVLTRNDASGNKQLVAYVVSDPRHPMSPERLRDHLARQLPDYLLPAVFVPLPALPLTANGKLDRQALPTPKLTSVAERETYAPPRDAVETQLVQLWQQALGVQPIGVLDRFFDLGGHSLLAVRLIAQIEKRFGRRLPVATLFQTPTIAELAELLRQEHRVALGSPIVEIQPRGNRPPLFLVHGAGGGMFWGYTNLARYLGPDQPVYALKSRGLDGLAEFDCLEDLAAHYVCALRAFQTEGPYCLGGYCFGGDVAYEMARQLQAQGQTVSRLILLNCTPPNSAFFRIRWHPGWAFRFLGNVAYWMGYYLRCDAEQRREFLRWKLRIVRRKLQRRVVRPPSAKSEFDVERVVDLSGCSADQRQLWLAHIRALFAYHPQPYAGHVTLFRTRGYPWFCSFDPSYGWASLAAGGVTVRVVPGAHESILAEPHVRELAGALADFLPPKK
ncbi:MAG: amino acid adenylation domain-containing protein [Verrucomicrobia bacterium]|nr:amino acid adenylation domain-containing protein [Verrucomicrobiota bacterium]